MEDKEIKIIDTDNKKEHGENRCPKCGASDVTYNSKKEKLVCNYCFTEFDKEQVEGIEEAKDLKEEKRGSGTKDIKKDANNIITLKCGGCGAEVVINTEEALNARCHWCRSILSINSQIDNGAVPDVVLPFKLEKKEAEEKIKAFVDKRKFFANGTFKKEFTPSNIMGVFFPYMLVDVNAHGEYIGEGEVETDSYKVKVKDDKEETRYDADLYKVKRTFDIAIDDLTIESNSDRLNKKDKNRTNNVINAIMPFDTENCVKYEGNYLVGFSSEKRNVNINNIEDKVNKEIKDITRHALNKEIEFYDRGVRWDEENLDIKGKQWISAYLPVWLYSYQDPGKTLHYVAVNARTGETMGSIPINKAKLIIISILLEALIFVIAYLINQSTDKTIALFLYGFLVTGPIYYFSKKSKYRNAKARHKYEKETKNELTNVKTDDELIVRKTGLSNSYMYGSNNHIIEGEYTNIKID